MTNSTNLKTSAEAFYIDPTQVKVHGELPRFRKDLGKLEDLAASLREHGQIQPIVVNRSFELIAGGRRLAACLLGAMDVLAIYKDTVDPVKMREMEVEENVQRKAFTASEEVLAVEELHRIKQEIYGASTSGLAGGWTLDKTAETIGKTRGSVIEDLKLAEALRNFPELGACKTKSDIKKAVSTINDAMTRAKAASSFDKVVETSKLPVEFDHLDAVDHMVGVQDGEIDLLLTDPPYGMDVFKSLDSFVSKNIGVGGFKYDDEADQALLLYQQLAIESYRFTTNSAHAYVFCCPEHFQKVHDYFRDAGWQAHFRPIIWVKRMSGQNNAPFHWPSSCYEMVMYARKPDAKLVKGGMPDWIQCDPVSDASKVHQAQKPVELLRNLISRSVYPNSKVYDPFAGSGSCLIAALEEKCLAFGCEKNADAYNAGRSQIIAYDAERKARP